ncbi:MAG TPA: PC4/YdbC family ssDNA-binding protein [Vicinamibacterales bacterium]|jgi:hypothetical protein|nr:PC4/YdbC family ssDNA-binding protein [Vicinamibacterales bacterium]
MSEPADVPADDGVKLATLSRGADRELRIRWRSFKGHYFVDVREWAASAQTGEWWPVKGKGVTIKARELREAITALQDAQRASSEPSERAE